MTRMRSLPYFVPSKRLLTTIASAKDPRTQTVPAHDARRTPSPAIRSNSGFYLATGFI